MEIEQRLRKAMRNDAFHRLPPGRKFSVFAPGGGGAKFASIWGKTWSRLPLWMRRKILRHWRENDPERSAVIMSPVIELLDFIAIDHGNPYGCVTRLGHMLQFRADRFAIMPEEVACDLVAHELMHVWQWADGRDWSEYHHGGAFDIETEADEMMDYIGFDSESLDRWGLEKGFVKMVNLATLTESQRRKYKAQARKTGRGPGVYLLDAGE